MTISRRSAIFSAAALAVAPTAHAGRLVRAEPGVSDDPGLARRIVGASHADIDTVRSLLGQRPELAKASWDWGFGDWETALGAASHTGRREIALLLIEHGARPTLFTHAMLGHLDVVRAVAQTSRELLATPGPHAITLMMHAKAGREHARHVVEFLRDYPEADRPPVNLELSESDGDRYLGAYRSDDGFAFQIEKDRRGRLILRIGNDAARPLNRVDTHAFSPSGSSSTRLEFSVSGGRVESATIRRGGVAVTAPRER